MPAKFGRWADVAAIQLDQHTRSLGRGPASAGVAIGCGAQGRDQVSHLAQVVVVAAP